MLELLQQERQAGLPNLVGSRFAVRIPLREAVLNSILRRAIARQGAIDAVKLTVLPANRLHAEVVLRVFGFRKTVGLSFHTQPLIDQSTGWRGVLAFAERSLASTLLATAAPFVSALPPGIALTDSGVVAHLPELLERAGAGDLLPHLSRITLETEDGTLWAGAVMEVSEQGGTSPVPSGTPMAGRGAHPPLTLDEIQAAFHGATADAHVRIAAPLVNALLAAGLDDAASAGSTPRDAPTHDTFARVRPWIEHHLVSFEEGAMVVDMTARMRLD